jgi:hypothetical protein
MTSKLSFKEYLDSKQQLLNAIQNTPTSIVEYEVKKYCSLPLGETIEDSVDLSLKPKHTVIVEWKYEDLDNPAPTSISIITPNTMNDLDEKFNTFWSGAKLSKWLARHTTKKESQ